MEDCPICYKQVTDDTKKELLCSHTLCYSCFLRLDKTICPLCRSAFIYSNQDQINRNKLNLDYSWQPPNEILNYIPPHLLNNILTNNNHLTNNNQLNVINIENNYIHNQTRRRTKRRRRKDLTMLEINERRRLINKRKKMKFQRKNKRFLKTNPWWELSV